VRSTQYVELTNSGSGRQISGIFMELPDRKDLPDYYKVIANPISLSDIEVSLLFWTID
jgi:hypothetical protein